MASAAHTRCEPLGRVEAAAINHLEKHEVGDHDDKERHGGDRPHGPVSARKVEEEGGAKGGHEDALPQVHDGRVCAALIERE